MKPTVFIKDAKLVPTFPTSSDVDGKAQVMLGTVEEYPAGHGLGESLSFRPIQTSKVVSVDGDTVETKNTIYKVRNWA